MQVPHLTTALTGPLHNLEKKLLDKQTDIEHWFRQQFLKTPAPFTCSVDLRNAGFKLAPVDTNFYPAGFNNLNPDFMPLCIQAAQTSITQVYPNLTKILLVPENHTRNPFYFESLHTLYEILTRAGFEVRIGSLRDDINKPEQISLINNKSLTLEPIIRKNNKIQLADFTPCLILLNNDLSEGIPDILTNLDQAIRPPMKLGWSSRLKSDHFSHFQDISERFASVVECDAWHFSPLFRNCGQVDFMKREGEDCLIHHAENLLNEIKEKYNHYQIKQKPFIVIKADAGTYGMGIMTIQDPSELKNLNRKQRTRMSASKGSQSVSKVILQEGVHTFETLGNNNAVAEPVVYMLGQYVVGGFYRVHKNRSVQENLNAPGMHFEPLAFAECCNNPQPDLPLEDHTNRFYAYGVIARLALLAAAKELELAQ